MSKALIVTLLVFFGFSARAQVVHHCDTVSAVQCTVMTGVKTCRHQRIGPAPTGLTGAYFTNATCNMGTMGSMGSTGVFYTAIADGTGTSAPQCWWVALFSGQPGVNYCRINMADDGLPVELMGYSIDE